MVNSLCERLIRIEIDRQRLQLIEHENPVYSYSISTALNGAGEESGSGCTPRGRHRIKIKIGAGEALNTVFVGRRPTGEIYSPELARRFPDRDWILTRIMWLTGDEPGKNRGGSRDSLRRFIYIHGTPASEALGVPRSHGCIRMNNSEIIELFDMVSNGTPVEIYPNIKPLA